MADRPPRWLSRATIQITAPLAWLVCAVAWLCIVGRDVRTVVVSGPFVLGFGILVLLPAVRLRHAASIGLGAAHVGIVLLFVALVNLLSWGPPQAERPFAVMGSLHLLFTSFLTLVALSTLPVGWDKAHCQKCGYLLRGLTSDRCPECGEMVPTQEAAAPAEQA